jgi:hypothetical protein
VACTAGLPGLARKAWKRLRRWRKANCQEAGQDGNKRNRNEQTAIPKGSNKTTAIASHCALSPLTAAAGSKAAYDNDDNARVESAANSIATTNQFHELRDILATIVT